MVAVFHVVGAISRVDTNSDLEYCNLKQRSESRNRSDAIAVPFPVWRAIREKRHIKHWIFPHLPQSNIIQARVVDGDANGHADRCGAAVGVSIGIGEGVVYGIGIVTTASVIASGMASWMALAS